MRSANKTPIYKLKAVLAETGLTADVLRAWERRYGLPKPNRTGGGHRLYSAYDIETIKWLQKKLGEGLSISQAVQLWKEMVAAGLDPLAELSPAVTVHTPDLERIATPAIEALRDGWLKACLAFDERTAESLLTQGFAMYPVETMCTEVLQQGLNITGQGWYLNQVSVQQEHFISGLVSRRLHALITAAPQPYRKRTVLAACPSGEWHTLPALLLTLLLRRKGIDVVYLGADTPIEQLDETAETIRPDLIVLAAQQLTTAAAVRTAALALRGKNQPLAYGGLIFNRVPGLKDHIPATFLGESLISAVDAVERLVSAPEAVSLPEDWDDVEPVLESRYRERRIQIERSLSEKLQADSSKIRSLAQISTFVSDRLEAALSFGDPAFMEPDLDWVKTLLANRRIPVNLLGQYLAVFIQVLCEEMGPDADPIVAWLTEYISQDWVSL